MKEIKELKFEDLTVEQKIGMVACALISDWNRTEESDLFVLDLIKNHALGCLWLSTTNPDLDEYVAKVKEVADYPLLIITDAESGIGNYKIGKHNSLGMTDSEELAYEFGKVTAIEARKLGFNVICDPVIDIAPGRSICSGNVRSLGSDKEKVATFAKAIARGMHDGGVLTVAKHYPGAKSHKNTNRLIDSHMAESYSPLTKEELIDQCLYPYIELMKEGLLDGIMTAHQKLPNIDPDYPASLSKKVIEIIRELGFDGFAITDSLTMMGVVAKFGATDSKGLAVENGNDIALTWLNDTKAGYNAVYDCYKKGILTDERLDEATKRVLAAQHKVFEIQPKFTEVTEEDALAIEKINTDSIYAKTDDNVPVAISKDGKHLFIVLVDNEINVSDKGKVDVDTFSRGWYYPGKITERIEQLFPNSKTLVLKEFPTIWDVTCTLDETVKYEDVVFITYVSGAAYSGREELTPRIMSIIEALQISGLISTVVHFGNPYVLEPLPHIERIIIGSCSQKNTMTALEVLAGNYPAKGKLTYDVKFE